MCLIQAKRNSCTNSLTQKLVISFGLSLAISCKVEQVLIVGNLAWCVAPWIILNSSFDKGVMNK
jgi:hypothetical protein